MSDDKIYYIYQYFDPIRNEPIYIGAGKDKRFEFHLKRKDKHILTHRINWIRKNGQEPIVTKLHQNLDKFDAFTIEPFVIKEIGRKKLNEGPLLNLTDGGEGISGWKHSEKSKEKIKQASLGRNSGEKHPWFGKHLPLETRNKISLAGKGRKLTQETKFNQGNAKSKNWLITFPDGHKENITNLEKFCRENNLISQNMRKVSLNLYKHSKNFKCKLLSEPIKLKPISDKQKEQIREANSKQYEIIFPDGHIETIKNLTKFCRENNLQQSNMSNVVKGKRKSCNGFRCINII